MKAENLFGIGTGKNHATVAVDQQQTLFKMADDLPQAATHQLQLGALAGKPFAQLLEPRGHAREHVILGQSGLFNPRRLAFHADAVNTCGDGFERAQQKIRRTDCHDRRAQYCQQTDDQIVPDW